MKHKPTEEYNETIEKRVFSQCSGCKTKSKQQTQKEKEKSIMKMDWEYIKHIRNCITIMCKLKKKNFYLWIVIYSWLWNTLFVSFPFFYLLIKFFYFTFSYFNFFTCFPYNFYGNIQRNVSNNGKNISFVVFFLTDCTSIFSCTIHKCNVHGDTRKRVA